MDDHLGQQRCRRAWTSHVVVVVEYLKLTLRMETYLGILIISLIIFSHLVYQHY
jgi:hypothetical protein